MVEHFSRSVAPETLNGPLVKLAYICEEHWAPPSRERRLRQPALLLIAGSLPRRLLSSFPGLHNQEPGLWSWERPFIGDVHLLVPRRLEERAGNALLQLIPIPRTEEEAAAGIERLLSDPELVDLSQVLLEELMAGTIPSTDPEQGRIIDRIRHEGEALGRREGEALGRRELLLRLLSLKFGALSDEVRARLEGGSREEVERWAERVLSAGSLEEVFVPTPEGR